jgi:hypothetical protein
MTAIISILLMAGTANVAGCLRFAYLSGRDLNDGGYPIYGDAIHNGMIFGLAACFSHLTANFYTPYQKVLGWSAFGIFILNVLFIPPLVKAGDRYRQNRMGRSD